MKKIDFPVEDITENGLLWAINRSLFHPRGYALALVLDDDEPPSFQLWGDGKEPWSYDTNDVDEMAKLKAFNKLIKKVTPKEK